MPQRPRGGPGQTRPRRLLDRQDRRHLARSTAEHGRDDPVREDDVQARGSREPRLFLPRPRESRAVRVGGIGRGENHGPRRVGIRLPLGAQPVEGARVGELQAAEPGHEVAPADATRLLEGPQHRVDGGEAAGHLLERDRVARQDPWRFSSCSARAFVLSVALGARRGAGRRLQRPTTDGGT